MNPLVRRKSFLTVKEALELANSKMAEDARVTERITLYELARDGDLPLSINIMGRILDFLHTDNACKAYLYYLITYDPITLNLGAGISVEVVEGANYRPNLKQPYTFKDSQSGQEVKLPEFPNGIIGFRSEPLNEVIKSDIGNLPKKLKAHYMDAPIKQARIQAMNPNDVSEIWGLLKNNAQSGTPWSPIGGSQDRTDYIECISEKPFSKEALGKYLKRHPHTK